MIHFLISNKIQNTKYKIVKEEDAQLKIRLQQHHQYQIQQFQEVMDVQEVVEVVLNYVNHQIMILILI